MTTGSRVTAHGDAPPPFVSPTDGPIIQGSNGVYSHGGNVPGFYALDYALAPLSPVHSVAAGTVFSVGIDGVSGRTGNTIRIVHAGGYASLYGHLRAIEVQVGEAVQRGQRIGLSGGDAEQPQPGRGYSTGGHLHFELWRDGVRVRAEALLAPLTMEDDMLPIDGKRDDGVYERIWRAARDATGTSIAFAPTHGCYLRWLVLVQEGVPVGLPVTQEQIGADGRVEQIFSSGAVMTVIDGAVFVN